FFVITTTRGEHATHDATGTQMEDKRPGVDTGDHGYAALGHELIYSLCRTPIACERRELAHHEAFYVRLHGFVVDVRGAVIADLRVRQDDDLAGIRRVGEYFLVAGERGVEDDFAGSFYGRTKTSPLKDRAVFQGENCGVQSG